MNSEKSLLFGFMIAILILVLCLSLTTSIQLSLAQTALDQTYTNMQCGITIMYPSDWIKEELNQKYGGEELTSLTGLANFDLLLWLSHYLVIELYCYCHHWPSLL